MKEFADFGSFAEFLVAMAVVKPAAIRSGLQKSVDMIVRDAKEQIGEYQPKVGPFASWDELAESTKEDRLRQGFPENEPLLRTGELRDSIQGTVGGMTAVAGSISQIMVWQELGTESTDAEGRTSGQHIPPRAVIGPASIRNEKRVVEAIGKAYASMWIAGSLAALTR
jgi:hypothetical protein